jgi:hypothetical protein
MSEARAYAFQGEVQFFFSTTKVNLWVEKSWRKMQSNGAQERKR